MERSNSKSICGDQDIIMMKIREQSVDEEIEADYVCPDCKAKLKVLVKIDELENIPFKGEYEIDFELPKGYKDKNDVVYRNGKLHIPTGLDREILDPVARKNFGEANTLMLTRCITDFSGLRVTNDLVRSLSTKDRSYLFQLLKDNMFGINLDTDVTCNSCGTEFKASLNMENFI
jgi:predicted nucleic acid-binding Zn ribbon protein